MALENDGGDGVVVIRDWLAVERFMTCIWSVIAAPVPVEDGVAVSSDQSALRVHAGRPPRVKPPTVTSRKLSPATSTAAARGRTFMLKVRLPPGTIWLPLLPLLHAPLHDFDAAAP